MDLTKQLDYARELSRDFVSTYTAIFKSDPEFAVLDYNHTSFMDAYSTMKSKELMSLHTATMWSYYYKSYSDLQENEHLFTKENTDPLDIRSARTPIIINRADPLVAIGFFNVGFRSAFPYELSIYNVWLKLEDDPILITELYRILFVYSQLWYKRLKSNMDHVISLPWPDDDYLQGSTFSIQSAKVADAVPGTEIASTTLVKNTWDIEHYADRFTDNGYRVIECLPNDIFYSPLLVDYFIKICDKKNIAKDFPCSALLITAMSCFSNKADTSYRDFKSMLWHYVYSKSMHVLLFIEDSTIIGHMEYRDVNDHSIQIKSYAFLNSTYEQEYSKAIMDEFLYDCQQGKIRVLSVTVNSNQVREYFASFGFKVAELNMIVPLPK